MDIRIADVDYTKELIYEVDANYFEVFSFPVLEGMAENAFQDNSSIVISKELADLYFNDQLALGQSVKIGESEEVYTITAVVDNSAKSHMKANIWRLYKPTDDIHWAQAEIYTYVRLNEGANVSELN